MLQIKNCAALFLTVLGIAAVLSSFGCSPGKVIELGTKVTDTVKEAATDAKMVEAQKALLTSGPWICVVEFEGILLESYERFLPNGIQIQKAKMNLSSEDTGVSASITMNSVHSWNLKTAKEVAFKTITDSTDEVRVISPQGYRPSFAQMLVDMKVAFEVEKVLGAELFSEDPKDTNFVVEIVSLDEGKLEYLEQGEGGDAFLSSCVHIDKETAKKTFSIFEHAS